LGSPVLLCVTLWFTAANVYSYIALPIRQEYEICFFSNNPLRQFHLKANVHEQNWSDWEVESAFNVDEKTIMVIFGQEESLTMT
jgi:hypothetical protein